MRTCFVAAAARAAAACVADDARARVRACRDLRPVYNGPYQLCGVAPPGLLARCATVSCQGITNLWACNPATPDGFRCYAADNPVTCLYAALVWKATGGLTWSTINAGWQAAAAGTPTVVACSLWTLTCDSNLAVVRHVMTYANLTSSAPLAVAPSLTYLYVAAAPLPLHALKTTLAHIAPPRPLAHRQGPEQ